MATDAFEELVLNFDSIGWYAAFMQARQALDHETVGKGYDTAQVGWRAWRELDGEQRRDALEALFAVYYSRIREEEHYEQLDGYVAEGKTWLRGWEEGSLHDAVISVDLTDEDAEVTVNADALYRVLSELDLLKHKLTMKEKS